MNARNHEATTRRGMAGTMGAALLAATLLLGGSNALAADAGKVDVNSASAAELAELPGIGQSKAAAIIAEREKKPFSSVDDLERVRGIGARTVEDLRSKVSVGGAR